MVSCVEEEGGVEIEETIIRLYYMHKKPIFKKRKTNLLTELINRVVDIGKKKINEMPLLK